MRDLSTDKGGDLEAHSEKPTEPTKGPSETLNRWRRQKNSFPAQGINRAGLIKGSSSVSVESIQKSAEQVGGGGPEGQQGMKEKETMVKAIWA